MKRLWDFIRDTWCYLMHPDPMWPVNGMYRCPSCQRQRPVPWEAGNALWCPRGQSLRTAPILEPVYLADAPSETEAEPVRPLPRLLNAH